MFMYYFSTRFYFWGVTGQKYLFGPSSKVYWKEICRNVQEIKRYFCVIQLIGVDCFIKNTLHIPYTYIFS